MRKRYLRFSVVEAGGDQPQVDVPGYVFILLDEGTRGEKNERLIDQIGHHLGLLELSPPK